jgi:ATP-dependent DNA helicase RecQ
MKHIVKCNGTWFSPAYLKISNLKRISKVPFALTATATPKVKEDIMNELV